MLNENNYKSTAVIKANNATFSVTIEIEDVSLLKGDIEGAEGDVIDSVQVKTLVQYDAKNVNLSQAGSLSIWADSMYDLLDLSLSMAHFAGRDDTTSVIPDLEPTSSYSYRAQWLLSEHLFDCRLLLGAKNTSRFVGKRFIDILFLSEEQEPVQCTLVHMEASPDAVKRFSEELHQMYEDVQTLIGRTT